MLGAMAQRGSDRTGVWQEGGAAVAAAAQGWEPVPDFATAPVLVTADAVVAADATLYYTQDLRRRLAGRGTEPAGASAAHLIHAAYRAWGLDAARHLEGDFAFVLWDRRERRLYAARDFAGKRTLFHTSIGGGLVVASTVGAILRAPGCSSELNLAAVAEDATGLTGSASETAYRDIARLPAGCALVWRPGHTARVDRFWEPPAVRDARGPEFLEAALHLRALLSDATRERMAAGAPTGIWLSGGWDSTAVYGAGQQVRANAAAAPELRPVSISYPPDDPGHEDWLIQAAVDHWDASTSWISIDDVPFWDRALERAAARDEPYAQAFETFNAALARGTRRQGAHINLDGTGGDQLFQVSNVYFADLARRGRLLALAREWRQKGLGPPRWEPLATYVIRPLLPERLISLVGALRGGRPWESHLDRTIPTWLAPAFVKREAIREREAEHNRVPWRGERSAAETMWYLTYTHFQRVSGYVYDVALREGVEMRSPLLDERVVRFAVSRPRWERSTGAQTKLLLRRAVRDLLPPLLLRPRRWRTGVTTGYFERSMRGEYRPVLEDSFRDSRLAALGIVDERELQRECARFLLQEDGSDGLSLFLASQAELWLRTHLA